MIRNLNRGESTGWFGHRYELPEKGKKTPASYIIPRAVAPRLIVLDEFYSLKGTAAIVY